MIIQYHQSNSKNHKARSRKQGVGVYIPAAIQHTDGLECKHPFATYDHCGKPDHQDLPCAGVIKITFSINSNKTKYFTCRLQENRQ